MIRILSRGEDGDYDEVARFDEQTDEWVEGGELFGWLRAANGQEVVEAFDGPHTVAERVESGDSDGAADPDVVEASAIVDAAVSALGAVEKEWVRYEGPRGGTGWRSTVTERIVYQDEKPTESDEPDRDELTWDDVADAGIQETRGWFATSADELVEGWPVRYYDESTRGYQGLVAEIDEDRLVIDTNRAGQIDVPLDGTEPAEGNLSALRSVFMADGVAASETSWLPDRDEGEPTFEQLHAEAVRVSASMDGFDDLTPLQELVTELNERGVERDRIEEAVEFAIDRHPYLHPPDAEAIMAGGATET